MATAQSEIQFGGLVRCLIEEDLLTEADAKKHIKAAQTTKIAAYQLFGQQ